MDADGIHVWVTMIAITDAGELAVVQSHHDARHAVPTDPVCVTRDLDDALACATRLLAAIPAQEGRVAHQVEPFEADEVWSVARVWLIDAPDQASSASISDALF